MLPLASRNAILARVVCPRCHHRLEDDPSRGQLACGHCAAVYEQRSPGWVDLVDFATTTEVDDRWQTRQREMTAAYDELIADPPHARLAYRNDLRPLGALLSSLDGTLLDVGGGNGLLRHVLVPEIEYISLDPEPSWLSDRWLVIADEFPCLRRPLAFVGGIAEAIPFADGSFDAVTSIWSLNHCRQPPAAISEIRRVLRRGGRFLLVLDDVPPRWRDICRDAYVDHRFSTRTALVGAKLASMVRGWPLQPDHLRITEREVGRWTSGFSQVGRGFSGSYFWTSLVRIVD